MSHGDYDHPDFGSGAYIQNRAPSPRQTAAPARPSTNPTKRVVPDFSADYAAYAADARSTGLDAPVSTPRVSSYDPVRTTAPAWTPSRLPTQTPAPPMRITPYADDHPTYGSFGRLAPDDPQLLLRREDRR